MLLILAVHVNSLLVGQTELKRIPELKQSIEIDADLSEWKTGAFSEGVWNMDRVREAPWFEPKRNRLVIDEGEDTTEIDLKAEYFVGFRDSFLILGAEVWDNVNDTMDSKHEPKRWYYKDAIAWFFELPSDTVAEKFGDGDHGFCFVMDTAMPDYGAWWRHGSETQNYIEEPQPINAVDYSIKMNPWSRNGADYIFEARINLSILLGVEKWQYLRQKRARMMIVHCDPDGGEYGGHMLIYGKGDIDKTWYEFEWKTDVE